MTDVAAGAGESTPSTPSDRRLWTVAGVFAVLGALLYSWLQLQIATTPVEELPTDPLSNAFGARPSSSS